MRCYHNIVLYYINGPYSNVFDSGHYRFARGTCNYCNCYIHYPEYVDCFEAKFKLVNMCADVGNHYMGLRLYKTSWFIKKNT